VLLSLHAQACLVTLLAARLSAAATRARARHFFLLHPAAAPTAALLYLFTAAAWGATGHAAQFSALSYGVGLLGWPSFAPARAGALLAAHTWGVSHGVLGGPALVVAAGEAAGGSARAATPRLLWALHALALAAVATLCAVERGNLMVWGVFAPKLCFEVAGAAAGAATAAAAAVALGPRKARKGPKMVE
jgi:hypothetical protein